MEVRERKKAAVHGTLQMTYNAVKFNFQQVMLKVNNLPESFQRHVVDVVVAGEMDKLEL